jgi:hypothetical protein
MPIGRLPTKVAVVMNIFVNHILFSYGKHRISKVI